MNHAAKYTKRPVTIEAVQYTRRFAWPDWFHDAVTRNDIIVFGTGKWAGPTEPCYCEIKTLEGTMRADENDWIIRGIKGEIYPCKPDIFEASYIAELEARPADPVVAEGLTPERIEEVWNSLDGKAIIAGENQLCWNKKLREEFAYALVANHYRANLSAGETAKMKYDRLMAGEVEPSALERLRFFCSIAMNSQDWLDSEPFFYDLAAHPVAGSPAETSGDWPEDFQHENGNYENMCSSCGSTFIGYKGRVTCKPCAKPMPASEAAKEFKKLIGRFPELNMSNYGPDEVEKLNDWGIAVCEAFDNLATPAAPTDAKPDAIPELRNAFMTLESNGGEGRTIVLKFNQREDAYAVHDFLLKGGTKDGPAAQSVRDALEQAESACLAERIERTTGDMNDRELAHNAAVSRCCNAIRALIQSPSVRDAAQPTIAAEDVLDAIPRESNDALIALARYWKLDGDWMTCKGCKRSLIASRDGEELNHADGCKHADQQHPWAQLRELIARRPIATPTPPSKG